MGKMLLQLDPNKRPSATEILDHPIVRARMQANPDAIQATAPLERDALIPVGTIQLPRSLVDLQRRLPGAKYSIVKPSDPNKNESGKPDPTPEPKTRRSSHSDEECKDTRHKRRDMLVAQSMDEGILARSKSHPEVGMYRKKGGRLENVRQSHPSSLKDDEMSLAQNAKGCPLSIRRANCRSHRAARQADATRLCTLVVQNWQARLAPSPGTLRCIRSWRKLREELCITRRRSRLPTQTSSSRRTTNCTESTRTMFAGCLRGSSERVNHNSHSFSSTSAVVLGERASIMPDQL